MEFDGARDDDALKCGRQRGAVGRGRPAAMECNDNARLQAARYAACSQCTFDENSGCIKGYLAAGRRMFPKDQLGRSRHVNVSVRSREWTLRQKHF